MASGSIMASSINSLVVQGETLVWHTGLPREGEPRTSPTFSYRGREWSLRFVHRDEDGYYHSIWLHLLDAKGKIDEDIEELTDDFLVQVQMLHLKEPDKVVGDVEDRNVCVTPMWLWDSGRDSEAIFRRLDWLRDRPEVKFSCRFPTPPTIPTDHVLPEVNQNELLESLSSDLSHMLEKELFPDVRLQCEGRTFRAHRSFLAARSDVFRAMFQNETLESQTGEVEIKDMDVAVFQVLLKSLYSGRLENISEGNAADLYEAADKYAVMSLKAACAYWIERHLAVENCVRYLVLADSHSDRDLKDAVVSFILKNPGILKSDDWLALSAELPVLAIEVYQIYCASTIP